MNKPDYLNLPKTEREKLTRKPDNVVQKSEPDELQIPLVRGLNKLSMIRPVIICNGCGEKIEEADDGEMLYAMRVGCRLCGATTEDLSIHDSWE